MNGAHAANGTAPNAVRVACIQGAPPDATACLLHDGGDGGHGARTLVRLTAWSVGLDRTVEATPELQAALADARVPWSRLLALTRRAARPHGGA